MGELQAGNWGYPSNTDLSEPFARALTERQLLLVRSRLIANLGASVASWFRIVPSDPGPGGELRLAALLLDAHLPILVPVSDYDMGSTFYVARYDEFGRRMELSRRGEMSRYGSLAEALLASDLAFRELKEQSARYRGKHSTSRAGELVEEQWLFEQLREVPANA
jgi:hypothetical protein